MGECTEKSSGFRHFKVVHRNLENDDQHTWNGSLCIPFHRVVLACGLFRPARADSVEQHLELPDESCQIGLTEFRKGSRLSLPGLYGSVDYGQRRTRRNEFGDEIDNGQSTITLRSHNHKFKPFQLDSA